MNDDDDDNVTCVVYICISCDCAATHQNQTEMFSVITDVIIIITESDIKNNFTADNLQTGKPIFFPSNTSSRNSNNVYRPHSITGTNTTVISDQCVYVRIISTIAIFLTQSRYILQSEIIVSGVQAESDILHMVTCHRQEHSFNNRTSPSDNSNNR